MLNLFGHPYLRDPLGAHGWQARVQVFHVELAVHEAREKDKRVALLWLDLL